MSFPPDPTQPGSTSSDPAELQRDIEEIRGELADTVDALAAKVDVKSRAQNKAEDLKTQATDKAREVRARAMAKAPQLTEAAQQKAHQAQRVVQDKPGAAAGAALAVLLGLLIRRRHRKAKAS